MKFLGYWKTNLKLAIEGRDLIVTSITILLLGVGVVCWAFGLENPIEKMMGDSKGEKHVELGVGAICLIWCLLWLPFKNIQKREKEFAAKHDETVTKFEKVLSQEKDKASALQSEVSWLKTVIEDESLKLQIEPKLFAHNRKGIMQVKVVNIGKHPTFIRNVLINQKPMVKIQGGGMSALRQDVVSIGTLHAAPPTKLEPHGGMHIFEERMYEDPEYMAYSSGNDGRPIGKGYIELTTGEKVEFQFTLLNRHEWDGIQGFARAHLL